MSNLSVFNLSSNAIRGLFDLGISDKKTYDVNLNLQVINIKKCDQKGKSTNREIFTATLSDSKEKYNGFLIFQPA